MSRSGRDSRSAAAPDTAEPLSSRRRWSAARKREAVLRLLRGDPIESLSVEFHVSVELLGRWRERAMRSMGAALGERGQTEVESELAATKAQLSEMLMENELLRAKREAGRPLGPAEVEAMSKAVSPSTGRPYGVERVCRVWELPRSSFYAQRGRAEAPVPSGRKRGPRPQVDDQALLEAIRAELADPAGQGEGHRKVWARLRQNKGLHCSRNRVLQLMRDNHLLSAGPSRPSAGESSTSPGTSRVRMRTDNGVQETRSTPDPSRSACAMSCAQGLDPAEEKSGG